MPEVFENDYDSFEFSEDIPQDQSSDSIIEQEEFIPDEVEVIGVRFKRTGKTYYFDPNGEKYSLGTHVLVRTSRGVEYSTVSMENTVVSGDKIVPPLRKVVRAATRNDEERYQANKESEREAFRIFDEKIAEHKLEMKLVDVEYTFDNNRLTFYFTADGRIDFRDLVKDLASVFKTRIELRQIGIRDETKIVGGLGVCGRPFCCSTFLPEFSQVSIKMAKEQNLSLNSAKISGVCGKLMCCLRFEHDTYEEEIKNTPKVDSIVVTPDGEGIVVEANPLSSIVKVKLLSEQDKSARVYKREEIIRTTKNANDEINEEAQDKKDADDTAELSAQSVSLSQQPDRQDSDESAEDKPNQHEHKHRRSRRRPRRDKKGNSNNNSGSADQ